MSQHLMNPPGLLSSTGNSLNSNLGKKFAAFSSKAEQKPAAAARRVAPRETRPASGGVRKESRPVKKAAPERKIAKAVKKVSSQADLDAELTSYMLKGKPEVAKEALDSEMDAYWAKKAAAATADKQKEETA